MLPFLMPSHYFELYNYWFLSVVQLSPSFVPTSVIRKMYETKEKSRDEPGSRPDSKEGHSQEGMFINGSFFFFFFLNFTVRGLHVSIDIVWEMH